MKTYRFLVSGKVQGVWYRKYVSEAAKKEGFKGYIKNLSDGRVEAVANIENEERLRRFIDILKKGSPLSRVEKIETEEISFENFQNFEIRY
ncbi:MAG: acylphosphatase [Nautiliaceae bacterium]